MWTEKCVPALVPLSNPFVPISVPFSLSVSLCSFPSIPVPVLVLIWKQDYIQDWLWRMQKMQSGNETARLSISIFKVVAHTNGVRKSLTNNKISVSQVWFDRCCAMSHMTGRGLAVSTCIKALIYWIKNFMAQKQLQSILFNKTSWGMLTDTSGYLCHTFIVLTLLQNAYDTSDCYCGLIDA